MGLGPDDYQIFISSFADNIILNQWMCIKTKHSYSKDSVEVLSKIFLETETKQDYRLDIYLSHNMELPTKPLSLKNQKVNNLKKLKQHLRTYIH